jgi:hypothetical protein
MFYKCTKIIVQSIVIQYLLVGLCIRIFHFMGIVPLRRSQDFTVANYVVFDHFAVSPIQVVSTCVVLSACVRPALAKKIQAFNLQTLPCLGLVAFTNRMLL